MLISTGGVLIRTLVQDIREMGRSTQGVTLINLDEGTKLAGLGGDEIIGERRTDEGARVRRRTAAGEDGTDEPRINFSAGPAALPEAVLRRRRTRCSTGTARPCRVMEMSHRGKEFMSIAAQAEADLRELLAIPANYKVLFLQGGATPAVRDDSR
jgi:hypothetical protein